MGIAGDIELGMIFIQHDGWAVDETKRSEATKGVCETKSDGSSVPTFSTSKPIYLSASPETVKE